MRRLNRVPEIELKEEEKKNKTQIWRVYDLRDSLSTTGQNKQKKSVHNELFIRSVELNSAYAVFGWICNNKPTKQTQRKRNKVADTWNWSDTNDDCVNKLIERYVSRFGYVAA